MANKLKFGTYHIEASVQVEDTLDLEDHFTKEEWNKLKPREQEEWLSEYVEGLAIPDLEIKWKLNK
jgi:acyl-CoA-binding protein